MPATKRFRASYHPWEMLLSLRLPPPIQIYLAAENAAENAPDAASLATCFASDAVVHDENRIIAGLAAILAWKTATKQTYQHHLEPLDVTEQNGKTILVAKVTGNFPGSPVKLLFVFGLTGDKISSLDIHP